MNVRPLNQTRRVSTFPPTDEITCETLDGVLHLISTWLACRPSKNHYRNDLDLMYLMTVQDGRACCIIKKPTQCLTWLHLHSSLFHSEKCTHLIMNIYSVKNKACFVSNIECIANIESTKTLKSSCIMWKHKTTCVRPGGMFDEPLSLELIYFSDTGGKIDVNR